MTTKLFLSIASLFTSISILKAQETTTVEVKNPPVIVETVFGDKALGFQTNFQKKLTSAPKFGIFAVSDIIGTWIRMILTVSWFKGILLTSLRKILT